MILTTSKNYTKENRRLVKNLSSFIYGLKYHSRKDFSLEDLAKKAIKKNYLGVIVYCRGKNPTLSKYYYDKKLRVFRWWKNLMEIKKIRFATSKINFEEPLRVELKSKEEKKIAQFFEINQNPLTGIYLKVDNVYRIKAKKNKVKFYYNKKKLLEIEYRWINV
ncbi:MAG: hypothetical protein ACK4J0_00135 [Candidatus Anstonellaceae archaeon]